MKETVRFVLRLLATPIIVIAYGFFWIGFLVILTPMFQVFSFLENEPFSWKEEVTDCNEFFMEPLKAMWGAQK